MKKLSLFTKYISLLLLLLCCFSLTACKAPSATVTIAGKEVLLSKKLKTCIDNGLITTNSLGEEVTLDTSLRGRQVSFDAVYLGNSESPHQTPVYVNCFNAEPDKQNIYECNILTIHYNIVSDNADLAPVLINGIDFWGMTEDEALDALKSLKMKVDYDEMHESHSNTFETGNTTWTIQSAQGSHFNGDSENPQKAVKDFDDDTFYISDIDISKVNALNLTTK